MKNFKFFVLITALFFVTALSLLTVDRRGALMYAREDSVSQKLQLFIENMLNLH